MLVALLRTNEGSHLSLHLVELGLEAAGDRFLSSEASRQEVDSASRSVYRSAHHNSDTSRSRSTSSSSDIRPAVTTLTHCESDGAGTGLCFSTNTHSALNPHQHLIHRSLYLRRTQSPHIAYKDTLRHYQACKRACGADIARRPW
jgi:hypothetical protein